MAVIAPIITAIESPFLSEKNTGLGNVLFQISSALGISKLSGKDCSLHTVEIYGKKLRDKFGYNHLSVFFNKLDTTKKADNFRFIKGGTVRDFDPEIIEICTKSLENIMLCGYMENELYFSHIEDQLIDLFSPNLSFIEYANSKYFSGTEPISIHFRGHEYFSLRGKPYNYGYYEKAVEYIKTKFENPVFFIFTDDVKSISNVFLDNINHVIINEKLDYECMWLMSLCKANILSFSTFSWWGAYFNKNRLALYDKTENRLFNFAIPI